MLYKLSQSNGIPDQLTPLAFGNLNLEKHLENLMADQMAGVLFEDNEMMPIFQERSLQAEADIYALNEKGDLIIFELKRGPAGGDAVYQALRYCETAANWDFNTLQTKLATHSKDPTIRLQAAHKIHFGLERALDESDFNTRQHLLIVGTAGSDDLIRNVNYWKSKGLSVNFIPYRVFEIGGESYFEFFSHPYDRHVNPAHAKGVIFDTNLSYDPESIWYMCENDRVAAFGDIKGVVHSLGKGDIVFLYHKGQGIIAAGEVKSEVKEDNEQDGLYRDLRWLTPKPTKGSPYKYMPAWQIKQVMDRNFWWAKTMKAPYLSKEEAGKLLEALKTTLE
ncbi:MAG: hypothetical protein NPIRA06_09490 [Nitrospirales bacterium]|nr:MAG: hypothetical protein NPIRA06_09490 [Nitrospirales bacterium]